MKRVVDHPRQDSFPVPWENGNIVILGLGIAVENTMALNGIDR